MDARLTVVYFVLRTSHQHIHTCGLDWSIDVYNDRFMFRGKIVKGVHGP